VLVFQIKPTLIACDDVVKTSSLDGVKHTKKLAAFCDPYSSQTVCQLVCDPAELNFFIPSEPCQQFKAVAGNMSRASVSERAEENSSLSKHTRILASR
jgi:hypothetical protein